MNDDSPRGISKFFFHFFSGTLISRITGALRDVAMAFCFGAHPAIAAFMVAFRFSHLFRRLFGEATTTTIFAPHFESMRTTEERKGALFFRDLFFSSFTILLVLTLIGEGVLLSLKNFFHFSPGTLEILSFTSLMFPGMLFICLYGLGGSLLQCEKRFFLPAVAPLAFNVLWIGVVFWLWFHKEAKPAVALSVAVSIGFLAQWLMTLPAQVRYVRSHLSLKEIFSPTLFSKELRQVIKPFLFAIIGVSAVQINTALDALFARFASLEGPAYLWYAIRIQQIPIALFGVAIMSALLPALSRSMEAKDTERYRTILKFALTRGFTLVFPCAVALIVLGASGINLLYGRGDFTHQATYHSVLCLWAYALGLIPYVFSLLLAPAFYAQKKYFTPMVASTISVLVNIALNAFFVFGLGWGAHSVALATSFSAFVNFFILYNSLSRNVPGLIDKKRRTLFWKISICSLSAGCVTLLLGYFLGGDLTIKILFGMKHLLFERAFVQQVLLFSVLLLFYGLLFFSYAKVLKVEEILDLLPFKKKSSLDEVA